MSDLLPRRAEALSYEELAEYLTKRLGDHIVAIRHDYATFSVSLDAEGYVAAAALCRDDDLLGFDFFDSLFGVDAREDGFDVVAILYSTGTGQRVLLRHRCDGGREAPVAPSLTHLYEGANWMERETWDMFGIEFDGHPGLAPRILCVENFEGWPLRKDFYLGTREAKPWPGVKEPAELDEEGNLIERVPGPGDAPGPTALDEAMAKQAKLANPTPEPVETATGPTDEPEPPSETMPSSQDAGAATPTPASEQADDRVVEGDVERAAEADVEAESSARQKAEEKRKAAAEARARKAAERGAAEKVTTPRGETVPPPDDQPRGAQETGTGGPPGTPSEAAGGHTEEAPITGGIHETADQAREQGTADLAAGDPKIEPEGRAATGDDATPDEAGDADAPGGARGDTDKEGGG